MRLKSKSVVVESERSRIYNGRLEWYRLRDFPTSEHEGVKLAKQLKRRRDIREVRLVVTEADGQVSRYTFKSRFPKRAQERL